MDKFLEGRKKTRTRIKKNNKNSIGGVNNIS